MQIVRYFSKSRDPIVMTLLAPGEEFHLYFSPKSCTYPILVTIDPLEVKIISILLYKNINSSMLFGTFTIDNSSFLTTVKEEMYNTMNLYYKYTSIPNSSFYKINILVLPINNEEKYLKYSIHFASICDYQPL